MSGNSGAPNSQVGPLHLEIVGAGEPLVLLHGFTGSTETWRPLREALGDTHRVIAIDVIGHGASPAPAAPERYGFERALDEIAETITELGIAAAAWLGYSMGGRLALGIAMRHPNLVSALILESAAPGIASAAERAERVRADRALAERIERDGIAAFVREWEALPMWASQRALPESARQRQTAQRLRNRPAGLANSLRGMGQGAQPSFWDRLPALDVPTLLVAGARDLKFARIAAQMQEALPDAELAIVPGTGHAVHLEQLVEFSLLVSQFLVRQGRGIAVR
jgi:2-succinyl-6-hydroxy-2,4-cyclohexadiene-1-carboxylate synthase